MARTVGWAESNRAENILAIHLLAERQMEKWTNQSENVPKSGSVGHGSFCKYLLSENGSDRPDPSPPPNLIAIDGAKKVEEHADFSIGQTNPPSPLKSTKLFTIAG